MFRVVTTRARVGMGEGRALRGGLLMALALATAPLTIAGCGGGEVGADAGTDAGLSDVGMDATPSDTGPVDTGPPPDGGPVCGDGELEAPELCDDGNRRANDGCSATCTLECGDGRVSGDELCDTAIASGEGSCPVSCDDGLACTTNTRIGAGCAVECAFTEITLPADGDACCPPDASSLVDPDCAVVCGNGLLEVGELCDTGIASGAGQCPASCDDGAVCTADALVDGGGCTARCVSTEIMSAADGDGCCPARETVASDADCSPLCGDGVHTPADGELCDTGLMSGPGSCPTACDDAEICTADVLVGAGTCTAICTFTILPPLDGDGCCPPGATVATDADCPVRCGDGVRTAPGEACDDGNLISGDGCSPTCTREARAYRIAQLSLQDPRIFNDSGFDGTPEVNGVIRTALTTDGMPGDGNLDLSIVGYFDPIDPSASIVNLEIDLARCTAPLATTSCTAVAPTTVMAMNQATGTCLGPIEGTIPVGRVVNTPMAPCYVSSTGTDLSLGLGPFTLRFVDTRLAGQYVGDPPTRIVTGLMRGFFREADAALIVFAGTPLSERLRAVDRDTHEGEPGWWFYFAFTAEPVPYTR